MRFAIASLIVVLASGCTADPAPLPPPRDPSLQTAPRPSVLARDVDAPPEPPTERHRYWGWTVAADLVTLPLYVSGAVRGRWGFAVPVMVATPLVHAVHGNFEMTALSFFLRAGLYTGAYFLERHDIETCQELRCIFGWGYVAMSVAGGVTSAIDLLKAYTDDPLPKWRTLPVVPSIQTNGKDLSLSATMLF